VRQGTDHWVMGRNILRAEKVRRINEVWCTYISELWAIENQIERLCQAHEWILLQHNASKVLKIQIAKFMVNS